MAACYSFGKHVVKGSQVFFRSGLSFGFVNRKPVVPGHILISPLRVVKRFCDLTNDEVTDLFQSTQVISKVIEKEYSATSLSIAIQDGPDAGQSVEHVHVHVLPRRSGDFKQNDEVYDKLNRIITIAAKFRLDEHDKVNFDSTEQAEWRSDEDMVTEATKLKQLFDADKYTMQL